MNKQLIIAGIGIWLVALCLTIIGLFSMRYQSQSQPVLPDASARATVPAMPIEIATHIPKLLYRCLVPKADQESLRVKGEEIKKIELLGQATDEQNQTYYYINVQTISNSPWGVAHNSFQPLIKLDAQSKCNSLHSEDEYAPLSYYVPMPVARLLALQWLKKEIEKAGGQEKYQQQLIDDSQHGGIVILLEPEKVWAHEQLNIRMPAGYMILSKPISRSQPSGIVPMPPSAEP